MAKYDPLGRFLRRQRSPSVMLTFAEMERVIGGFLPKAARSLDWWRSDAASPQATAWRSAGFWSEAEPIREAVTFHRMAENGLGPAESCAPQA